MSLSKLIEAVEAGTLCSGDFITLDDCELIYSVFPLSEENHHAELVSLCMEGSLDAALSLHKALLPGWHWRGDDGQGQEWPYMCVWHPEGKLAGCGDAEAEEPARAWLLAILRAMEGKEGGE